MARQVYYDPFGQRLAGFMAGVDDEVQMQDQTRRARAADWDYNNLAPLRLQEAQRTESLQQYADPYLRNAYGIQQRANLANLYGAEQGNNAMIGQTTGNYAPYLATAINYGSGRSQGSEDYYSPQVTMFDQVLRNQTPDVNYIAKQFGVDPNVFMQALNMLTGTVSRPVAEGVDQYYGYDRARQMALDNRTLNNDTWERQLQTENAIRQQQQVDQTGQYYDYLRSRSPASMGGGVPVDEDGF